MSGGSGVLKIKRVSTGSTEANLADNEILSAQPGPWHPALGANASPEVTHPFCRLPLDTLTPSTRGYSPWRPDAVIGTDRL